MIISEKTKKILKFILMFLLAFGVVYIMISLSGDQAFKGCKVDGCKVVNCMNANSSAWNACEG